MNKSDIRILVQEKISHMSEQEKENESSIVCTKLINILSEKEFETIVAYHAFTDEIDISKMSDWYSSKGKKILLIPQSTEAFEVPDNSIIIVPGRAFTENGIRVGRGSGYYDKLLNQNKKNLSIGVCFDCQIFPNLPEESWDQRVGEVVFSGNILE